MFSRKGNKAKELLENEAFKTAVDELEREYFEAFKKTDLTDVEARERLHVSVNVIADIVQRLGSFYSAAVYEEKMAEKAKAEKSK